MAIWSAYFRDEFTGTAGTPATGWVPGIDLVGKKWKTTAQPNGSAEAYLYTGPSFTLKGDGTVDLSDTWDTAAQSYTATGLTPDLAASRTGSVAGNNLVIIPPANAPKNVAVEYELVLPAVPAASVLTVYSNASIGMAPPSGLGYFTGTNGAFLGGSFTITHSPSSSSISITLAVFLQGGSSFTSPQPIVLNLGGVAGVAKNVRVRCELLSNVLTAYVDGAVAATLTGFTIPAACVLCNAGSNITATPAVNPVGVYSASGLSMNYLLVDALASEITTFLGTPAPVTPAPQPSPVPPNSAAPIATTGALYLVEDFAGTFDTTPTFTRDALTWAAVGLAPTSAGGFLTMTTGPTEGPTNNFVFTGTRNAGFERGIDTLLPVAGFSLAERRVNTAPQAFRATFGLEVGGQSPIIYRMSAFGQLIVVVDTRRGLRTITLSPDDNGSIAAATSFNGLLTVRIRACDKVYDFFNPPTRLNQRLIAEYQNNVTLLGTFYNNALGAQVNQTNKLAVQCAGYDVAIFVNDVLVGTIQTDAPIARFVGIGAGIASYNRLDYIVVEEAAKSARGFWTPDGQRQTYEQL